MPENFDPYYKWLGIAPRDQPPNHYRLLAIDVFESDRDVIDSAANRIMAYLKDLSTGDDAVHSQRLLNEVAKARICLLNAERKAAYDKALSARQLASSPPARDAPVPPPLRKKRGSSRRRTQSSQPAWLMPTIGGVAISLLAIFLLVVMIIGNDGSEPHRSPQTLAGDEIEPIVDPSASVALPRDPPPSQDHVAGSLPQRTPLFNGIDLTGWRGSIGNPTDVARMSDSQIADAQYEANRRMREHWEVIGGVLVFDGRGDNICTVKQYRDFELFIDWKVELDGEGGIFLRGCPQVQLWDAAVNPTGSGGLYNNVIHSANPLTSADNPTGEWNSFRIRMIGQKVSVWLNDILVVHNVVLENKWERGKPVYDVGPIELQTSFRSKLYFKNIFIREL